MFNLFGSKSKKEKLEAQYLKLTEKAHDLEQSDTKKAAEVKRKAQLIMHEMVMMDKGDTGTTTSAS
ncbi:MAG: Lacal_2735 family protein [Cyclobacteriaceae bacterium]